MAPVLQAVEAPHCYIAQYFAVVTLTSLKILHVSFTTDTCFSRSDSDPKSEDFAMYVTDQHQLRASVWAGKLATLQMFTQIQTPL